LEIWRRLRLSSREATALLGELAAVIHRYEAGQRPGGKWLIHVAVGCVEP
jgi:hypothetical protein